MHWLHPKYSSDDGLNLIEINNASYKPLFFPLPTCNNAAEHAQLIMVDWRLSILPFSIGIG